MQTLQRLRRFRDLRAVSPGARPPADGVPSPLPAATDQEARPAFPNPFWPRLARLGSRPPVTTTLIGTGPESGAVPRGRQRQRVIRFRLSRERARLPDRVCRAALDRQTASMSDRRHRPLSGRQPVCVTACLPVCARACWTGWPADRLAAGLPACLPVRQSACLYPLPVR